MCPKINNLEELIQCLQNAVKTNGVKYMLFGVDLFPEAVELVHYLQPDSSSIRIDQIGDDPLVQPGVNDVHVVGRVNDLFPKVNYDVDITGTVPEPGIVRLGLKATPADPANWSFSANFPDLPTYTGYDYEKGSIEEGIKSFFDDTAISPAADGSVFWVYTYDGGDHPKGLSLVGRLNATVGTLGKQVGPYLPGASDLAIGGAIEMRSGAFPVMSLTAPVPDFGLDPIALVRLDLGTSTKTEQSTAAIAGTVHIKPFPPLDISGAILQGNYTWILTIRIPNPQDYSLTNGVNALSGFVGGHDLTLPAGLAAFSSFYLDSVTVALTPKEGTATTVSMIGVSVLSPEKWVVPLAGVTVADVGTSWQFVYPAAPNWDLVGSVFGNIYIDPSGSISDTTPRLQIEVNISGLRGPVAPAALIEADLDADPKRILSFPVLFKYFTDENVDLNIAVTQLSMQADTGQKTFFFSAAIKNEWQPLAGWFEFRTLIFEFTYSPNNWTTNLTAVCVFLKTIPMQFQAAYRGQGKGWRFDGALLPEGGPLTVQKFLDGISDRWKNLPQSVASIALLGLSGYFDTLSKAWGFNAIVGWDYEIEGLKLAAEAEFKIDKSGTDEKPVYVGFVRGQLAVNAFLVRVIYSFDVGNNNSITFQIAYGQAILTCTLTKNDSKQQILTVNLGGVSFGDILEYLVNLVDPNSGFTLSSPWDVLNQIKFDNLNLKVNLTTREVGISYKLNLNLGFMEIESIGLTYLNKAGSTSVDIAIAGRYVDQTYTETDPLKWDLLNDPAPAPAGQGDQLLDLRFLGFGQNVGFRETRTFKSVQDVIVAMTADFNLPSSESSNPLLSPTADKLKFTGDDRWLIGADFTLMSAVALAAVFNDPVLYGLRVGLAGPKVGSFSGLQFEILYKKVTDTVGVYHIELTLPDAFRQLQFGAVSITLPVSTIDIYTNGNFRIDCGFPVNLDYSRSFCLQFGPFIGYGGFYFALLDGSTSERVPRIANGNFSPVIELGLALSVGLGRTFDKGIISAGVSITVEAVLQGVFGWFNPNDQSAPSAFYYWIQGTAGIVGKLYGTVDFKVIKADINLVAYASITLTIEAYRAVAIDLKIGVRVSVSVKIVFFRVTFSFAMEFSFSFTVGNSSPSPWVIDNSQPAPLLLRQQVAFQKRRGLSGARLQTLLLSTISEEGSFDWTPRPVFPAIQPVPISLVPALTVAEPQKVFELYKAAASAETLPAVQVVMSLFVPNSMAAETRRADQVRKVALAEPSASPFNLLAIGMLRWALSSYKRDPGIPVPPPIEYVLASDLDAIAEYLNRPGQMSSTFTYERLAGFIELNYQLRINTPCGPSGQPVPLGGATGPEVQSTVFPIIPDLEMTPQGGKTVQFWNAGCITPSYESALDAYYKQLQTNSNGSAPVADGPVGEVSARFRSTPGPSGCDPGSESLSTFLFRDYFGMLTKGGVNSAIDLLKAYPYEATGASGPTGESLQSIADDFDGVAFAVSAMPGDTLGTIAGRLGISASSLVARNPHLRAMSARDVLPTGTDVQFTAGVTPASIVNANPNYPLRSWAALTIEGVRHQIKVAGGGVTESLGLICSAYGIQNPGSVFTWRPANLSNPNADNPALLRPGAAMTIPGISTTIQSPIDNFRELVAAFYFVRNLGPASPDDALWYSLVAFYEQWIATNNLDLKAPVWKVPIVTIVDGGPRVTGETQYAPQVQLNPLRDPDTTALVAGYFAMIQLMPEPYTAAFQQFLASVQQTGSSSYFIPPFTHVVRAGDTMQSVATLFGAGIETLANANTGSVNLFQALAVLALPAFTYYAASGDTFSTVAGRFDLTLDELADSVKTDDGILSPYASTETDLTIPDVPGRNTNRLTSELAQNGNFNDVSGMLSRFMLHGLRVADTKTTENPWPPNIPLWGMYEMAKQQFPFPKGVTGDYDITFRKGATADWICFEESAAPSGPTGCVDQLVVTLGPSFIAEYTPALTLYPQIVAGPTGMPLYKENPPQYALQQSIHWQSSTSVALPGASGPTGATAQVQAGQPSVWMFPATLLDTVAAGPTGGTPDYELVSAAIPGASDSSNEPMEGFSWATVVDIRIQQAAGAGVGQYMSNSYLLLGADQSGRDRLLQAWSHLESQGSYQARLYVLYSPGAQSNNTQGLASDPIDPANTFLLKTNLSTVTHSNESLLKAAAFTYSSSDTYYSRIDAIAPFLKFVWEASVTGSGGFYLNYVNASNGNGLPAELFANGTTATIRLLLLLGNQSRNTNPVRRLYPFNNCAVIGENVQASSSSLFAQLEYPAPAQMQRTATVPPGNVGFYLARLNPDVENATGPLSPEDQTRSLYNLAGFRVIGNTDFAESNEGLPVGPQDTGITGPTGPGIWHYQQVVPVYRLGLVNDTPQSTALPQADQNPYRGITGPTGPSGRPLSNAVFDLAFHDIYGNQTAVGATMAPFGVTVGYTDPLASLSSWPGIGANYIFLPGPTGAVPVETELSLQIDKYTPAGSYSYTDANGAAQADAARYGQIFYQVQQFDLAFSLETNLGTSLISQDALKAPASAFVSKAKVYTDASASVKQQTYTTSAGDQLGGIAKTYSVTAGMLGTANASQPVKLMFQGDVVHPVLVAAPAMNTLRSLAEGQESTPFPPVCSGVAKARGLGLRAIAPSELGQGLALTKPMAAASALTPAELATNNAASPLTAEITLRTKQRVSGLPVGAANTLQAVAAALQCNVYNLVLDPNSPPENPIMIPVGLYFDNRTAHGVVAPGISITIQGITFVTGEDTTFADIEAAFAPLGLTMGDFVVRIQTVKDIFRTTAQLKYSDFIVPFWPQTDGAGPAKQSFTILDMPAGTGDIAFLADTNRAVANFYYTGTPIYLNYKCYAPNAFDTLALLADQFKVTVAQLAFFNSISPLQAGIELLIPNLTYLGDPSMVYAPYSPATGDSLNSIAILFGSSAAAIGGINRYLPAIFAEGVEIHVSSGVVKPGPLDSLESTAALAGLSYDQFLAQIAPQTDLYRTNGVTIAPLPTASGATLNAIAEQFNIQSQSDANVSAVPLLDANRSLEKFLRTGAVLKSLQTTQTLTAGPYDTVDTIIRRFKEEYGVDVPVEDLAAANGGTANLLTEGRYFLLPPNPTRIPASIRPQIPPQGKGCESSIVFPVHVGIRMNRSLGLVAPEFRTTPNVFEALSTLSPRGTKQGPDMLSLNGFAQSFEDAFSWYRLKCAISKKQTTEQSEQPGEIWAVNFGSTGVATFDLRSGWPQFYALEPLSTQLLTSTVPIRPYKSGCGFCRPVYKKFESVDLDSWMQQFLSTVDLFLDSAYSIPAFQQGGTAPMGPDANVNANVPTPALIFGPVGFAGAPGVPGIGELLAHPSAFAAGTTGATAGCQGCTGGTGIWGPANYNDIVAAKATIAEQLKYGVVPILNGVGATYGYYGEEARETLYQQMLIQLSDAYNVNAIVQYPVDVQSPCTTPPLGATGSVAPRVSGKIVPELYVSPKGDVIGAGTLAQAASTYAVSPPSLAEVIANAKNVLLPASKISYNSQTYTVQPGDTLNTAAAFFKVPTNHNPYRPDGDWQPWSNFIEAIALQSILDPAAAIPASALSHTVSGVDTLASVAACAGTLPGMLGLANQSLPGIFIAGAVIPGAGVPYTVKPEERLVTMVDNITRVTVPSLCERVATRSPLLAVNKKLAMAVSVNSLRSAASYFQVSTPSLAETVGKVQGLLLTGAEVYYLDLPPYTIGSNDTLNDVAMHFGVPTSRDADPSYWTQWTEFITWIGTQDILNPQASFPVVKIARQVLAGDTLGSVAAYAGVDAGGLGEANQTFFNIFRAGEKIEIPGYNTYVVQSGDTLLTIVAALNGQPGHSEPITVDSLCTDVANQMNLLNTGETLYYSQPLPDVTLSTAKVSLGRVSGTTSYDPALSFLFSVKQPGRFKSLFLNLKYVINEAEYGIFTPADVERYQASSWLTFILPLGSGEGVDAGVRSTMDQVQIPVPLRSYPSPPSLVGQSASATEHLIPPGGPEEAIAQGKEWDYGIDFQSFNAAQDTSRVEVTFNDYGATGQSFELPMPARTQRIFQALAEFTDAYPQLMADLSILPSLKPGLYSETAAVAVMALDVLASNVARAMLPTPQAFDLAQQWPQETYLYKLQTVARNIELRELLLGLESATGQFGPTGPVWPEVFVKGPAVTGPESGYKPMPFIGASGMTATFEYPAGYTIDSRITQRFVFPARDVIRNPNSWSGVYLTRNEELIASGPLGTTGPSGPTGPRPISTSEAFLYQTPMVRFIDPATPFLDDRRMIDVSGLTGPEGQKTLQDYIRAMLAAVLELGPQSPVWAQSYLSILCLYGFGIGGGSADTQLVATTPIRLVPTQILDPASLTAFSAQLALSIEDWYKTSGPDGPTGTFVFDLSVYSPPAGATSDTPPIKPILEFGNLSVPLNKISGL